MDEKTLSHGSDGKPQVLRESEFYGGCIRVKISVRNTSSLVITGVALELESDEKILHFDRCEPEYPQKNGKIILDTINPHTDRTIAFYLDPLICAKEGTDINCRVNFKYADGRPDTVNMELLKIQVVCPIFRTEHDINIGRLKELIKELHSKDSKVYAIPKRVDITESLKICGNVIQQHDVRHIKTFKTTDDTTYECWYFGKTKVTKKDIIIKCTIRKDTDSIEIFVSGNDPKDITGLLAEIGRNLTKEFEKIGKVQPVFNIVIKNSMIKGSNLLSFCDLNGICGGNVVIDDDSLVEGSNIASWMEEDKEKTRIGEQKKLEQATWIKPEKEDKRARIEPWEKSSGGKWFFGVIIIFAVLALGWYGTQDSGNPVISTPQKTTSSVSAVVTTIQSPKSTPSPIAIQTPKFTPTASPAPIIAKAFDQKTITNSIGMEFILIPDGEFDMGSPSNEAGRRDREGPVHRVKISNAFYMGKYEVTQKQWRDVMGKSPYYFESDFKGDDMPVDSVSWDDVQDFIKKLNEKEGGSKYRLPTEAEWEYAARAGTTTRYSFGDDMSMLGDYAWYNANAGEESHGIGQKKPNPWGLYDMHGNVWEWVQDVWHRDYNGAPTDGSSWEGKISWLGRVVRGGGWNDFPSSEGCRSAVRSNVNQGASDVRLGFRLLKEV